MTIDLYYRGDKLATTYNVASALAIFHGLVDEQVVRDINRIEYGVDLDSDKHDMLEVCTAIDKELELLTDIYQQEVTHDERPDYDSSHITYY